MSRALVQHISALTSSRFLEKHSLVSRQDHRRWLLPHLSFQFAHILSLQQEKGKRPDSETGCEKIRRMECICQGVDLLARSPQP